MEFLPLLLICGNSSNCDGNILRQNDTDVVSSVSDGVNQFWNDGHTKELHMHRDANPAFKVKILRLVKLLVRGLSGGRVPS